MGFQAGAGLGLMLRRLSILSSPLLILLLLLGGFAALVSVFWTGFVASDDVTFATGGYGWIEDFPFVGGHGTIRYPITIPLALSFLSFGGNEVALALPSLLYMIAAMAIAFQLIRSVSGKRGAILALLCVITTPLFMVQGSIANVDMPELFYQLASFALFLKGLRHSAPARWFFAAGMMAGLGFLTRETSVFIAGFYALLFFAAYQKSRWQYLWIAAGFLGIWSLELLYLGLMTGDPLYRITIALNHDSSIDRSIDVVGNFIIHPALDPLLVLLINQEFMLLFWLAIPAAAWMMLSRTVPAQEQRLARLLALYGLAIFMATGAAVTLLPLNPRYFTAPAFVAALLLGMAAAHLWQWRRGLALLLLAALLGSNMVGAYVENRHSVYGVRVYAALAARLQEPVYTDPMTRYRAELPLKWHNVRGRAIASPPQAGVLYFWNPALAATPNSRMTAEQMPDFARPPGRVIAELRPPLDPILAAAEAMGLRPLIPSSIGNKLAVRHPPVVLIRVVKKP